MKISIAYSLLVSLATHHQASAWSTPQRVPRKQKTKSPLPAWMAGAVVGLTISAQVASSAAFPVAVQESTMTVTAQANSYGPSWFASPTTTTITIASGAYIPDESFSSTDLSMPSYRVDNEVLGGLTSTGGSQPAARMSRQQQQQQKLADPEKEAARVAKFEAKAAAQKEKEAAAMQRKMEAMEKMAAKKAERAAIQSRRTANLSS